MKIIIIGGGITGLYIGNMLNKYNIDFTIYEKTKHIGGKIRKSKSQIYPHHIHIINLLNELNIKYNYESINNIYQFDHKLFDKIRYNYNKINKYDITVGKYLNDILSEDEYKLFMTYIQPLKLDQMELSYYMKYHHDNILAINQSNKIINIGTDIIKQLANPILNNIILNSKIDQITHMPITNNYMLSINDRFINADKIILTTANNIKLIINKDIKSQLNKIQLFNWIKIKYNTNKKKSNYIDYISSDNDNLYNLIINDKVSPSQLLDVSDNKPIINYSYKNYPNSYMINKQRLVTNFYVNYNLILALNYINSLEGSCIIGKNTIDIILNQIYSKKSEYLYSIK